MIAAGLAGGRRRGAAQDHRRVAPGADRRLRGRPPPLPPAARGPARRRRRLLLRGHRGPLQRRPGQQPGQPGVAGDHGGPLQVRRGGPGLQPRQPAGRVAAGVLDEATAAWARLAPHEALEETWRLIGVGQRRARGGRALEDGPGPGGRRRPGRRARGAADRGRAHRPGHAVDRGRDLAPHRARRRPGRRPACPTTPSGAATPAGPTSRRATPCSPGARPDVRRAGSTRTATCRRSISAGTGADGDGDRSSSPSWPGRRQAGHRPAGLHRDRGGHLGPGGGPGAGRPRPAGSTPRAWASVGLHPHEASEGVDEVAALLARELAVGDGAVVAVGECGLDYYYEHSPRDAQRAAFAEQIALAHAHGLALVIHARDAWDDLFDVLGAEGVPERTVLHCFTGGPDEVDRLPRVGHVRVVQRHRHVQERGRRARRRGALPARPAAGRDRQPVPRPGAPSRPRRTSRRTSRSSARRSPPSRAAASARSWSARPRPRPWCFPQAGNSRAVVRNTRTL